MRCDLDRLGRQAGVQLGDRCSQAIRQHHLALGLTPERAARTKGLLQRRHGLPAERRRQPDCRLLDELVFSVSVGTHRAPL